MKHHQLLLFPRPPKPVEPLRHRWLFTLLWSECGRCYKIWPPGASAMAMLTEECDGKALDMAFNVYLC